MAMSWFRRPEATSTSRPLDPPKHRDTPRFMIQQVTEHCWCLQERVFFESMNEYGYTVTIPAAEDCTSEEVALWWMRYSIRGGRDDADPWPGETLVGCHPTYYDDHGELVTPCPETQETRNVCAAGILAPPITKAKPSEP